MDSPKAPVEVAAQSLLEAQKLEAIGRLAGRVAHDFNNLIAIIAAAGTLLNEELGPDHPSQPMTLEIREACRRAADLTRQLLAFSRRQLLKPGPVDVNALVRSAVESLKPQLDSKIQIATHLEPKVASIQVDQGQIETVVAHLVLNARDAMPQGGALTFRTCNVSVSASEPEGTPPGEYVMVEVTDTGVGMDALTRSQLFEPFFTTKPRGKGLGLGLATCWGVVKQSHGTIRVRSTPGGGTTFSLLFPVQPV